MHWGDRGSFGKIGHMQACTQPCALYSMISPSSSGIEIAITSPPSARRPIRQGKFTHLLNSCRS